MGSKRQKHSNAVDEWKCSWKGQGGSHWTSILLVRGGRGTNVLEVGHEKNPPRRKGTNKHSF